MRNQLASDQITNELIIVAAESIKITIFELTFEDRILLQSPNRLLPIQHQTAIIQHIAAASIEAGSNELGW